MVSTEFVWGTAVATVAWLLVWRTRRAALAVIERERLDREQWLEAFANHTPVALYLKGADGRYIWVNRWFEKVSGIAAEACLGRTDEEIMPGEAGSYRANDLAVLSLGAPAEFVETFGPAGPSQAIFYSLKFPLRNYLGEKMVGGVSVDITEQRRAKALMSQREAEYRQVVENATDIIYRADVAGRFTFYNRTVVRLMGYGLTDLIGEDCVQLVAGRHRDRVRRFYTVQMLRRRPTSYLEFEVVRHDGASLWIGQTVDLVIEEGNVTGFQAIARDITDRRKAEDALRTSEEQYRRLFEQNPLPGFVVDRLSLEVIDVNEAAIGSYGYTRPEFLSMNFRQLWRGEGDESICDFFFPVFRHEVPPTLFGNRRKDGREIVVEMRRHEIRCGQRDAVLVLAQDVTEKRTAEQQMIDYAVELRMARIAAERAAAAKGQFLAVMSHEIRTPMNGVIGMTDLLLETPLRQDQREYATTVKSSAEALLGVINDILDFTKLEAGKMQIEHIPFDLGVSLDDVVSLLAPKASNKGLVLFIDYAPGVPRRFVGDPGRIRQIVINLAGNALKFTEHGHVGLRVSFAPSGGATGTLRLEVEDTGIGIPKDKQKIIFDKFTQADSSTTREYGGTGLGLSICRQLAELMNGEMEVYSEPGRGSVFALRLPVDLDLSKPAELPGSDACLKGVKVLVVDDHPVNRKVMLDILAGWEMRGISAADTAEAMERLGEASSAGDPVRIALLDANLPGQSGEALATSIHGTTGFEKPVLVMLSSNPKAGDRQRLEKMGFSGFLPKPVRPKTLRQAFAILLDPECLRQMNFVTQRAIADAQAASSAEASSGRSEIVLQAPHGGLRVLLAEDNQVNQRIALTYLQKCGCKVDVAANGRAATDLWAPGKYRAVFMDCNMPEMDGYEATRAIRLREGGDDRTYIIAMTANALSGDRERCIDAGMDDYLSKPISLASIQAVLDRMSAAALAEA